MHTGKIKLILLTLGAILVIAIIALFTYGYFESKNNGKTLTQTVVDIFPRSSKTENTPNTEEPAEQPPVEIPTNTTDIYTKKIRKIASGPISGSFFTGTSTVRYVDKGTGNVYEYSYYTNTTKKLTSTVIPGINDTFWVNNNTFFGRYADTDSEIIRTFLGTISNPGESGVLSIEFFEQNIKAMTVSPKGDRVAYLVESGQYGVVAIYDIKKKTIARISTIPGSEYSLHWNENGLYAQSNASFNLPGYLLKLSLTGEQPKIVIPSVLGLLSKPIKAGFIVSSFSTTQGYSYIMTNSQKVSLENLVIPEKCVEAKENIYCAVSSLNNESGMPDSWYSGETRLIDRLEKINIKNPLEKEVVYTSALGEDGSFDMINLQISQDYETLIFTEKGTGDLWSIDIR